MNKAFTIGCSLVAYGLLLTACVAMPKQDLRDLKFEKATAFGFITVESIGPYSRGYETQLRFFHLLNRNTQERIRVDVQSSGKAFGLALDPGDYEVIRVQINEGPMMMESHVSLRFQVQPNKTIYLGAWEFDVDTPRTQRMLRMTISHESPNWEEISLPEGLLKEGTIAVSLIKPPHDEVRLYTVAPYPKTGYYYR